MAELITAFLALSLTVTKAVDFVRNLPFFKNEDGTAKLKGSFVWNVVALVIGLAMCVGWEINLAESAAKLVPALADMAAKFAGTAGEVLTGIAVGLGGSALFHEVLDSLSSYANRNNTEATGTSAAPADI